MRRAWRLCAGVLGVLMAAVSSGTEEPAPRWYNAAIVANGQALYGQHCAACHGADAGGAGDWRTRDAAGNLPPPPLNGTAHTWHHPSAALIAVILDGSPGAAGSMPAWRGVLDAQAAASVIAYLQSLWSDEVYAAWYRIELKARR